jgi:formylglycine-generating enzyme required for sulfatase activity
MVHVGTSWVYQYEATRPDATATSPGGNSRRACSNAGVMPWADVTQAQAAAACASVHDSTGAAMRLCTAAEWQTACEGPGGTGASKWSVSANPATYVAQICNDYNESATPAVWATGSNGAMSTARAEYCYTDWGAAGRLHDMSGNLGEWTSSTVVSGGNTYYQIRGGSCTSPQGGTACEFNFDIASGTFADFDIGFRCCSNNAP